MNRCSLMFAWVLATVVTACDTYAPETPVPTVVPEKQGTSFSVSDLFSNAPPKEVPEEGGLEVGDLNVEIKKASLFTPTPYLNVPLVFDMTFSNKETFPVAVALHAFLFDSEKLADPTVEAKHVQKLELSANQISRSLSVVGPAPRTSGEKLVVFDIMARNDKGEPISLSRFQLDGVEVVANPGL